MNPSKPSSPAPHHWWTLTLFAAVIMMVMMGTRQSLGLFVSPLNTSTGLGIVAISFAMAIGQFVWGAVQPIAGAIADRYGPGRVLASGIVILAAGSALTTFVSSSFGLAVTLGILAASGAGAASFSVLIGATAQHVPAQKLGTASGVINAGGSVGQFVFAPVLQKAISAFGWMGAMWTMTAFALAALPFV
jgi:MFS family permease